MEQQVVPNIMDSARTALVDRSVHSDSRVRPRIVFNDASRSEDVRTTLLRELEDCDTYDISVAFITLDGISSLAEQLIDGGKRGRILTTDYSMFNNPRTFRYMLGMPECFEVRVGHALHTKGYIFHRGATHTVMIGSSNMTQYALKTNCEWNLRITSTDDGELVSDVMSEFNRMWDSAEPLTEEWISGYEAEFEKESSRRREQVRDSGVGTIEPNPMQMEAMASLAELRRKGATKALVISATGTGKTYLSAFDAKAFAPRRMLFLVHRENILDNAISSYRRIFGNSVTLGKYMGSVREDAEYLFASIQTMSRSLDRFPPETFDYIVCDEVHHLNPRDSDDDVAVRNMYHRIIRHFRPRFMLGMTATPERTDGADIYRTFEYNIAQEVRLNRALSEELLCPFHYFGITDLYLDDEKKENQDFNRLVADDRVDHICRQIERYPHSGSRLRALMFCHSVRECRVLSEKLNQRGYRTLAMSADNSAEERADAVRRLQSDDVDGLDIILTRDIFNEGIDIPKANEVILLRPTKSVIVYIQQLGRGLRKANDKEFLTVLDFIGNYDNNYMIPMALYGDGSRREDSVRRKVILEATPGASTVSFDRISRERIFAAIDSGRMGGKRELKSDYLELAAKLGHPPTLCDLYGEESIDPRVVFARFSNINNLRAYSKLPCEALSDSEDRMLSLLSEYVAEGKRPHEGVVLRAIMDEGMVQIPELAHRIRSKMGVDPSPESVESAVSVLCGRFFVGAEAERYAGCEIAERVGNAVRTSVPFARMIRDPEKRALIDDIIGCSELIFRGEYSRTYDGRFSLGQRYSRKDVCRLLNSAENREAVLFGYRRLDDVNSCPIFVNYHKDDTLNSEVKYEESFIDRSTFRWATRQVRREYMEAGRIPRDSGILEGDIIRADEIGMSLPLFVKKGKSDNSDFYYLGMVHPIDGTDRVVGMLSDKGEEKPVMTIDLRLERPVEENIYRYLITE